MQRKFLTNLGLLLFLNLLIKPVWIFGIDLNVQRLVGVGDYGFYFVILNLTCHSVALGEGRFQDLRSYWDSETSSE